MALRVLNSDGSIGGRVRQITQISAGGRVDGYDVLSAALCDDNTLWLLVHTKANGLYWVTAPKIPQPDPEQQTTVRLQNAPKPPPPPPPKLPPGTPVGGC